MNLNASQLKAHRAQIDAEATEIDRLLTEAVETKSFAELSALEARVTQLAADRAELNDQEDNAEHSARFTAKMFDGTDQADEPTRVSKAFQLGRDAFPLGLSRASLKTLHGAVQNRSTVSVKAFSTVDSLLPATLDGSVLGPIHENRLLDRLPVQAIGTPSYEIIQHNSTTGAPTPVAEGGLKPELVLNTTPITYSVIKLACHLGISYESIADWSNFTSYAQNEMMAQLADLENAQLLSGSGASGNMTGFSHTSGILTHDASGDTGTGVTVLDSIEKAITQLRVGSALAVANLLVLNPSTWSAIRRLKDTTGRFLFIPADSDPTRAEANSIFGIPVLTTTAQPAGAGLLLDTSKFGRVLVREGITVHTGQTTDDFTRNISRWVMEERLVLAVERPAAVLQITNLPTA